MGADDEIGAVGFSASRITSNVASGDGAGIDNAGTLSVTASIIRANSADGDGGGLYNSGTATLKSSKVTGDTAASGGGIYAAPGGSVTLIGTLVTDNKKDNIFGSVTYG